MSSGLGRQAGLINRAFKPFSKSLKMKMRKCLKISFFGWVCIFFIIFVYLLINDCLTLSFICLFMVICLVFKAVLRWKVKTELGLSIYFYRIGNSKNNETNWNKYWFFFIRFITSYRLLHCVLITLGFFM